MHEGAEHPDPATIVRMGEGREETPQDVRKIVRHLLRGCPECRKLLLRAIQPEVDPSAQVNAEHAGER